MRSFPLIDKQKLVGDKVWNNSLLVLLWACAGSLKGPYSISEG